MKYLLFVFLFTGLMFSCSEKDRQVDLDESPAESLSMDSLFEDTTKVLNVYLPTLIDSANQILVHKIYVSNGKDVDASFSLKRAKSYEGPNLVNLIFEDVINKKTYLLTNNQLQITSYDVISQLIGRIGKKYILYRVIDKDYNKDGVLDGRDIGSLYISDIDGTSFTKITKDNEDMKNSEWMYPLNRYYFRTMEDTNKDGYFDIKDKIHYYYIQFDGQGYQTVEYSPLEIFNK
ncbi:hypothetical protein D0T84_11570 [Dysgonomonas sp. 521]|uniref:hypothetical protein n=1 Tax=Dysgonomonas sp. 521 TaxID=2302932 RepID=UPI0013D1F591|nr:hypothetical protein [Dysgonomonas sp. 521]NDV95544.1 hypothetical protein [Dysgonomonas sp. 521]